MPFRAKPTVLSEDERAELAQMTQSRTLPAGGVFRARLILMLAEGLRIEPFRTDWMPRHPRSPGGENGLRRNGWPVCWKSDIRASNHR
jgi:hypothetical protein